MDTDPDASTSSRLDEIATIDVQAESLPFEVRGGIDCIIYDGILERLRDPWGLLRRHAEALSPDGMMLIRVPNMEHWSVADRLLCGTWSAAPSEPEHEPYRLWLPSTPCGVPCSKLAWCCVTSCAMTRRPARAPRAGSSTPSSPHYPPSASTRTTTYGALHRPIWSGGSGRKSGGACASRATCWRLSAACRMSASCIRCRRSGPIR